LISLDGASLRHNVLTWKQRTGAAVRAVVKADGYNFGVERIVRELDGTADGFVVSDAVELQRLRAIAQAPAATLQELGAEHAMRVASLGGIVNVAHLDSLAALAARSDASQVTVRLGLRLAAGWSGIELDAANEYARMLAASGMRVELWTHLTNPATEKTDRERFARFVATFQQLGAHVAGEDIESTYPAAAGAIHGTSVRIGVGLFGAGSASGVTGLQCAIAISAPVVETLASGGALRASYSERALPEGTHVTVVRCGYSDGFPRITGAYRQILSVGMQNTILLGRAEGDRFALLGTDDDLDELTAASGVLPHQIVTGLGLGFQRQQKG
jgi:alanine racemase